MKVTLLEYKQNKFCNCCFEERSDNFAKKHDLTENVVFSYMGMTIDLDDHIAKDENKKNKIGY